MLDAISYSEARKNLASLMESVCDDSDVVVITRRKARPVVLMSLDEYNSIQETAHLLRNPANAERLLESIAELQQGKALPRALADITEEDGQ
ncbi:type II toxin-antitoxin system prevent-host-death family antitoxin [Desulfobulbus sp.]|uniref:type II toxin-antitoxin system Phd/YefM family antitoxin n=1 Tax=Desulfobulbus sp. TaxID=895 RepID=UPI00286EC415|nr:type II toxin-antitoxin system prevent-host-death family antitoxin [Desulfobulbus sp.]